MPEPATEAEPGRDRVRHPSGTRGACDRGWSRYLGRRVIDPGCQLPKPLILILSIAAASAGPAFAQMADARAPVELEAAVGAGGQAYLEALRGSGTRPGLAYFDPARPPPGLRTDIEVEPPSPPDAPADAAPGRSSGAPIDRWVVAAVAALVLLAILLLATRFGGARAVSLVRPPERGVRSRDAAERAASDGEPAPDDLEVIARLADRRHALHVLLERSLERATQANGGSLARSLTARAALRRLPAAWPLLPALRTIVRQAEIVRFGGRELTDEAFQACLDAARPIFAAAGRRGERS